VLRNPEWRALYRRRVTELLPLFAPDRLLRRIDEVAARLKPVLAAMGSEAASNHADRVRELKDRINARARSLKQQSTQPDPKPVVFDRSNTLRLRQWRPMSECEDARISEARVGGERLLRIEAGRSGRCVASWRSNVLLSRGRYRLQATLRSETVAALEGDPDSGVGLRLSGDPKTERILGTSGWRNVTFEFTIGEDATDVELVAELRGSAGAVWFKLDAFRLLRVPE
jgi:hypothetical protein